MNKKNLFITGLILVCGILLLTGCVQKIKEKNIVEPKLDLNSKKDKESTKEKSKITQTCDELCKLKNYSSGICRNKALHPDVKACEKDEIKGKVQ